MFQYSVDRFMTRFAIGLLFSDRLADNGIIMLKIPFFFILTVSLKGHQLYIAFFVILINYTGKLLMLHRFLRLDPDPHKRIMNPESRFGQKSKIS